MTVDLEGMLPYGQDYSAFSPLTCLLPGQTPQLAPWPTPLLEISDRACGLHPLPCRGLQWTAWVQRRKILVEGTYVAPDAVPDPAGGSGGPNEPRSASNSALHRTADVRGKWRWLSCGQGLLCAEKSG